MKKMLPCLFALFCLAIQSQAQTYINNQTTLQPSANFYIAGTAQSNTLKTFAGTSANGVAHFHLFNGDGNLPANLRWTNSLIGLEGAGNTGSDFRLFRYSNTGTYLGFGLAIERATGNVTVGNLTAGNLSKIQGNGTTANQSILQFMQNDNTTRDGYIGVNPASKEMFILSDAGNVGIYPSSGTTGSLKISNTEVTNSTGSLTMTNNTSNLLSFNPVGVSAPTFTSRSVGTRITLHPALGSASGDYAIGIEPQHMWLSVNVKNNNNGFKFYAGTDQIARIDGFGASDWEGQGRFKGWYTANGTGMAAELGVSGGRATLIGFDRTTGATKYIPLYLAGGTSPTNQTIVLINDVGLGIGTVNPQSKLAVNGTITAKQVKVTQTGWSDYVFHKDYQLPTLAAVEKYVATHQHLEGIPSAAEVEKDGIDVGDMNKKLLAKVEELTLYLIEQNKKIAALEEWKVQQEKKKK